MCVISDCGILYSVIYVLVCMADDAIYVFFLNFHQNISTLLVSQEPVPLLPNHLISAVVEYHHNKLSPVEMDEMMLDDGVFSV